MSSDDLAAIFLAFIVLFIPGMYVSKSLGVVDWINNTSDRISNPILKGTFKTIFHLTCALIIGAFSIFIIILAKDALDKRK